MRFALFSLSLAAVAAFFHFPGRVIAQMTPSGCLDMFGQQILPVASPRIKGIGLARRDKMHRPVIVFNPRKLARLKRQTRVFFYAHECAHHALGHTMGLGHPMKVEQQADCWAIRNLVYRNIFTLRDVMVVQDDLSVVAKGSRIHLPGHERAKRLPACLTF